MSFCKTLARSSLLPSSFPASIQLPSLSRPLSIFNPSRRHLPPITFSNPFLISSRQQGFLRVFPELQSRNHASLSASEAVILDPEDDSAAKDNVEQLLSAEGRDEVSRLMKMERKSPGELVDSGAGGRWFPYLDRYKTSDGVSVSSSEVLEAMDPHILDGRKERFKNVVKNRSYSVCLVIEGLSDFGNVSAACRSADALGFQSVHVVSCDSSKRYRENRHVSMGAEKWLDIEVWDSIRDCFDVLRSRGYRIATTHIGTDSVAVDTMDWSVPTAIVVGNESRGISQEALELSDMHCKIPMRGMVDSFNVSVAAGVLMHHAVCDRTSRLGCHGDLTPQERQILLAEFSLRHSKSSISIVHEFAKRKVATPSPRFSCRSLLS